MAEQPFANALQSRNIPMLSVATPVRGATWSTWGSWPVSDRKTPTAMSSSIEPMKI
jgi:hypothetical protein